MHFQFKVRSSHTHTKEKKLVNEIYFIVYMGYNKSVKSYSEPRRRKWTVYVVLQRMRVMETPVHRGLTLNVRLYPVAAGWTETVHVDKVICLRTQHTKASDQRGAQANDWCGSCIFFFIAKLKLSYPLESPKKTCYCLNNTRKKGVFGRLFYIWKKMWFGIKIYS